MAFAKLSQAVRRNELLLLASLLAGLVMALFEMAVTWTTMGSLWAFPGYVSAIAFRSLQLGGTLSFSWPQIATGFVLHLAVAMAFGALFAWMGPRLREATGLEDVAETPAYGLLGAGFGFSAFAIAWLGVLPYVNPVMVRGLDPMFFGIAHGIWGLCLGVTRRAWTQTTPRISRQTASSPTPSAAGTAHKAPSGGASGGRAAPASEEGQAASQQGTFPAAEENELDSSEEPEEDPYAEGGFEATEQGDEDELSPWPAPPDPDEGDDGSSGADDGDAGSSRSTSGAHDEDDEDDGLAMTEHARRVLRGLTDREPDLPPVHQALDTTLTHVAPGRAVCTIDADERLHDATGAVQSGVLISLAELAATIAMQTDAPDAEHATVGSDVQVRGFVEEGHVVAEAEVTEVAGTTTLAKAEVRDAAGNIVVKASFQAVTHRESDD